MAKKKPATQTSYHSINKWAKEALQLLRQGKLDGVRTQLDFIASQSAEEMRRAATTTAKH